MPAKRAPWWYRQRAVVLAAIFGSSFLFGWLLSGPTRKPYQIAAVWFGERLGVGGVEIMLAVAAGLVTAGWLLRMWGAAYLSAGVVYDAEAHQDRLLVDGPFRYVRNPLYLGIIMTAAGTGLLATPIGLLLLVTECIIYVQMLVGHEASGMRERYGPTYDAYARAVPSLIPRLSPATVEGSVLGRPDLAQALISEVFFGCLAMATVWLLFDTSHVALVFGVLGGAGWIAQRIIARSTRITA